MVFLSLWPTAEAAVMVQAEKRAYHDATSSQGLHAKQEELQELLAAEHAGQAELQALLALRRAREARIVQGPSLRSHWFC